MDGLNFKKHKQSKFFTIMLVPYSSKKTVSIRIPHWLLYALASFVVVVVAVMLMSRSQTNYFKLQADSISQRLSEAWQINSKLSQEKAIMESDVRQKDAEIQSQQETYQERLEREKEYYQSELKLYEEKAKELEQKIEELDGMKNEIYDLLSQKAGSAVAVNVAFEDVKEADEAGGYTFLGYSSDTLETVYLKLEEKVEAQITDFEQLYNETKRIKPYLDAKPSIWPVWGIVTSEVGSRGNPFGGPGTESHTGVDIAVPTGTKVKAAGAGKVTHAGWSPGYGYLVTIDHGYGIVSMYGHNSKVLVDVGQWVARGDIIAKSGNTGRSTGPHVHYEIQVYGVIKNPRNFID